MDDAFDIATRRELFVDDCLIEELRGARRVLQRPTKREVVLRSDQPFENCSSCYYNLFQDGDRIRMYYRGYMPGAESGADHSAAQCANLAESADGIHFERPNLGLYEVAGSRDNNVVWVGAESHNFHAFRDDNPACPPDERYKAVGGGWQELYGLVSPDGVHWRRLREEPLEITGAFDSLNVCMWDALMGCYRMFSRYFTEEGRVRAIQSATSDDFIHWSDPLPYQYAQGVPLEHFYTNATVQCPGAEHILLSFPKRFVSERTRCTDGMVSPDEGVSDNVFMSSRDGVHWDRTFMEAWVRPGLDERNWTHRSNMPAAGIAVTGPTEWSMYVSEHYGWDTNRLRRVTVRPWGFVSVCADYSGGEFTTRPLLFGGAQLRINYATSAVGSVQVEVQGADGRPIDGFAVDDMEAMFGDELDAPVSWTNGGDLASLIGRPVRFRFVLKDADVFSIRTV